MDEHPFHQALKRAVERAGNNQSQFARDIGTSQQLVSYWLAKGKPLPGEMVLAAERAGYGSRHELRPDIYPLEETIAGLAICSLCDARPDSPEERACSKVGCPMKQKEAA